MLRNHSKCRFIHHCDTPPTQNAVHVVDGVLVSTPTPVFVPPSKKVDFTNYSLPACASRGELSPVKTTILDSVDDLEFTVNSVRDAIDTDSFIND